VSGDGGIECEDWQRQEELTFPLTFAQFYAALASLRNGGVLILKTFSLMLPATQQILVEAQQWFGHVCVSKPTASKAANSELYIIAREFRFLSHARLNELKEMIGRSAHEMTMWSIPSSIDEATWAMHLATQLEPMFDNTVQRQVRRIYEFAGHESCIENNSKGGGGSEPPEENANNGDKSQCPTLSFGQARIYWNELHNGLPRWTPSGRS